MQPREGGRHRSAVLATGMALALALVAFGVWAFASTPSSTPATTAANLEGSPAAGSTVAGTGPATPTAPGVTQRPAGSSGVDPHDLDALAASEDAAAGQTPGQRSTTRGASFVGEVGTYLVGRGIPAGTYESEGGRDGRTCHWFRLRGLSGAPADVVASGSATGPTRVTIVAADAFFQTRDCATWRKVAG